MKFLEELANDFISRFPEGSEHIRYVFPNRRAGLFFRKYISGRVTKPIWSPKIMGIEEFIYSHSSLRQAEKLDLVFDLYLAFKKVLKTNESFDTFFYWGNVLINDFNELDKFLIEPAEMFRNLAHLKTIEADISYLQEEQRNLIAEFWRSFGDHISDEQKGFLALWTHLPLIYHEFRTAILAKEVAYDGLVYRQVAESPVLESILTDGEKVIFAGFNALSASEEKIISRYVSQGKGEVFWDADDYYLLDRKQEAGRFLREMKETNPVLRATFKSEYANRFRDGAINISVIDVASETGQAQQAADIIRTMQNAPDENTAIVLPNSELLLPVLYALPESVEKLNITMGYPLSSSIAYGLIQELLDLQEKSTGKDVYFYRHVLALLNHPIVSPHLNEPLRDLSGTIIHGNILWISSQQLHTGNVLGDLIFRKAENSLSEYIIDILALLISSERDPVQQEFLNHFYRLIQHLQGFIEKNNLTFSPPVFRKMFRLLVKQDRLPFDGEPLDGLQILGILETRNIDFDNVILLSATEDSIPPASKNMSFIPHSIRRVYGLPVAEQQDAIYAYLFYRLLQRATNVCIIYNSSEVDGSSGEASRFIRQLKRESSIAISFQSVSPDVTLNDPVPITIAKTDQMISKLHEYTSRGDFRKKFAPSALNTYLDCSLKFYFKYIKGLYEPDEMTDEVDAMVFGNIFHKTMENLYSRYDVDGNRVVSSAAMATLEKELSGEIDRAFAIQFGSEGRHFAFEGQFLLARRIIEKMARKVLELDKEQVPFEILGVEANESKGMVWNVPVDIGNETIQVGLKGVIDRIERKNNAIRIVDYKTGKDESKFDSVEELFDPKKTQRRKAVFQTLLYGLIFNHSLAADASLPLQASLYNMRDVFRNNFSPLIKQKGDGRGHNDLADIRPVFDEFTLHLQRLLAEIFNREMAFTQTDNKNNCKYCPYNGICRR